MVNIEIDGKKIEARDGVMVIEAADEVGITIPRFCYHKKLSVAANCRMCLVEVEKAAKPLPACATPVTDGMKVFTRSAKAISAQQGVMEFLLINHPLDCPICDQGGECELQDVAVNYGGDVSRFSEKKRVVKDKNIGPLVATEMTRCIHCTRCVRFCSEIAGVNELGATGRSEFMQIGTYIEKNLTSELSGNVIDLCPVGALTSKPYQYSARAWELKGHASIAPHDVVGSNITVHSRRDKVLRVVPRENETINESWISDRDRFSYEALNSEQRLHNPMVKNNGKWQETDWETALSYAVDKLNAIKSEQGVNKIGALVSASATTEELYLAQKLLRGMGSSNIDHRLRQNDFSDQQHTALYPSLGFSIENLEKIDSALLVGSHLRKEQPILNHRLRKAVINGGAVNVINPVAWKFNYELNNQLISTPADMVKELAAVLKAVDSSAAANLTKAVDVTEQHNSIAEQLKNSDNAVIILGSMALNSPYQSALRGLAAQIAKATSATIAILPEAGNSAGAWLAGAVPHRSEAGEQSAPGLNVKEMLESNLSAYLLMGVEPESDCAQASAARSAMQNAFVVSMSMFVDDEMLDYADVLLPIAPYTETSGSYVNTEGTWQSFTASVKGLAESRPAWKVLRVLGNLLSIEGFDYMSTDEVKDELLAAIADKQLQASTEWPLPGQLPMAEKELVRIAETAIYATDSIVRRAKALQETEDGKCSLKLSQQEAGKLGLLDGELALVKQADSGIELAVVIDDAIPVGSVYINAGSKTTAGFGQAYAPVEVSKAEVKSELSA